MVETAKADFHSATFDHDGLELKKGRTVSGNDGEEPVLLVQESPLEDVVAALKRTTDGQAVP